MEVTSNIWGTKFKIHGLASFLPDDLGQILYKTSLLHLQPRQMTITLLELANDLKPQARDPNYNANQFSESEDELPGEWAQSRSIPQRPPDLDIYHLCQIRQKLITELARRPYCLYQIVHSDVLMFLVRSSAIIHLGVGEKLICSVNSGGTGLCSRTINGLQWRVARKL